MQRVYKRLLEEEFTTPDLYFATYLLTSGAELKRTDRKGTRIYFIFNVTKVNVDALKASWVNRTGTVPAMTFADNLKAMKSMCHHRPEP